jgi:hypothetical protein
VRAGAFKKARARGSSACESDRARESRRGRSGVSVAARKKGKRESADTWGRLASEREGGAAAG